MLLYLFFCTWQTFQGGLIVLSTSWAGVIRDDLGLEEKARVAGMSMCSALRSVESMCVRKCYKPCDM